MLEHPGWSGVLVVEEDIVMATKKPAGDNARKGTVRKRSQLKTAIEGEEHSNFRNLQVSAVRSLRPFETGERLPRQ